MTDIFSGLTMVHALEYAGSGLSIIGAEMMSRSSNKAPWGWAAWLAANTVFVTFAAMTNQYGILIMQLWFMKTSLSGIKNHLVPMLKRQ